MTDASPRLIPDCLPGQILLRNELGEWECIWPPQYLTRGEKWFLGCVFMTAVAFICIAVAIAVIN